MVAAGTCITARETPKRLSRLSRPISRPIPGFGIPNKDASAKCARRYRSLSEEPSSSASRFLFIVDVEFLVGIGGGRGSGSTGDVSTCELEVPGAQGGRVVEVVAVDKVAFPAGFVGLDAEAVLTIEVAEVVVEE